MEAKIHTPVAENFTEKARSFSSEYLLSFKNPAALWENNWFAVVLEVSLAVLLFQVFRYAKKKGCYSTYLLLSAMIAPMCFEILPLLPRPGYQLWWYHSGIVNVLDRRVPSYVISLFALIFYAAHTLTERSNLPNVARSTLTAVCATLLLFPCLWLAPRLMLFFYHFDDPVFKDQLSGVPYIQIVVSLLLFFHVSHLYQQNYEIIEELDERSYNYWKAVLMTGLVAAIYSLVEQYLLYIALTLTSKLSTGWCLFSAILILVSLSRTDMKTAQNTSYSVSDLLAPLKQKLWWMMLAGLVSLSTVSLWLDVSSLKSTSDRLELGPCEINHSVSNTSPLEIERRRYVCDKDAEVLFFDFHCVPENEVILGMQNKTSYYTTCGKALEDPVDVSVQLIKYSAICLALFYCVMLVTFNFRTQTRRAAEESKKVQ